MAAFLLLHEHLCLDTIHIIKGGPCYVVESSLSLQEYHALVSCYEIKKRFSCTESAYTAIC